MSKTNVFVKICGLTNEEDARWAANLGANYIGLNFCAESPRKISVAKAAEIRNACPPFVKAVGVFMNPVPADLEKLLKKVKLDAIQLHGEESPEAVQNLKEVFKGPVWKALRVENAESLAQLSAYAGIADAIVLDAYKPGVPGGTGETFDWELAVQAKSAGVPIVLAGGLNAENVSAAVKKVAPAGVDAASGVEKDGHPRRKDMDKMTRFIQNANP